MRRFVSLLLFVVALTVSGGGVAYAAPSPTPTPAPSSAPTSSSAPSSAPSPAPTATQEPSLVDRIRGRVDHAVEVVCTRPPSPGRPDGGIAGKIDPGPANPRSNGGMYETRGYAGFDLPIYDPGCVPGTREIQKRVFDGPNVLAGGFIDASLVGVAILATVTRITVVPGGAWDTIDAVLTAVGVTADPRLIGGALVLAVVVALMAVLVRHNRDADLPETATQSAGAAGIALLAILVLTNTFFIGPTYDKASDATFAAVTSAANIGEEGETADVIVAQSLIHSVVYPLWSETLLGKPSKATDGYAWRLYAAGSYTRDEAKSVDTVGGRIPYLMNGAKQMQYRQVARELQGADPGKYEALSGVHTTPRVGMALLMLASILLIGVPLLAAVAAIGLARMTVRAVIAVFPFGALFWVWPTWQGTVPALARVVGRIIQYALVGLVVYAGTMVVVLGGVMRANLPYGYRLAFIAFMAAVGPVLWHFVKKTAPARQAAKDAQKAKDAAQTVADQLKPVFEPLTQAATDLGEKVTAAAGERYEDRAARSGMKRQGRRIHVDTVTTYATRARDAREARAEKAAKARAQGRKDARAEYAAAVEAQASTASRAARRGRRLRRTSTPPAWNKSTAGVTATRRAPTRRPTVKKAAATTASVVAPAPVKVAVAAVSTAKKVVKK